MASPLPASWSAGGLCINDVLTEDELRAVLSRFPREEERDLFGLVCKRWLRLQSTERRRLCSRAGPVMLHRMAERFPSIVELDLSQSRSRSFSVGDADLAVVASGFPSLRSLSLCNCKGLSDVGIATLSDTLLSLKFLDASGCRSLTDKGLVAVANGCPDLRILRISNCRNVTDGLLQALSRNCPHLEELNLLGCNKITDSGLSSLVGGCRRIKSLDVSKCAKVSDSAVSNVARVCSWYLRVLRMLDCNRVGDGSIFSLAESCKNLETLHVGGCRNVTGESLKVLAISCGESLQNLRIDWCSEIGDSALGCILLNCSNLVALDISCCERVTDSSFHKLGQIKSTLKVLRASNCSRITVSTMALLMRCCRSLEYLDVSSCAHITKEACEQAGLTTPDCCKVKFSGSLTEEKEPLVDIFF